MIRRSRLLRVFKKLRGNFNYETWVMLKSRVWSKTGYVKVVCYRSSSICYVDEYLYLFFPEQKWLLVFDNVDAAKDLKDYWPSATRGSILLTSQN